MLVYSVMRLFLTRSATSKRDWVCSQSNNDNKGALTARYGHVYLTLHRLTMNTLDKIRRRLSAPTYNRVRWCTCTHPYVFLPICCAYTFGLLCVQHEFITSWCMHDVNEKKKQDLKLGLLYKVECRCVVLWHAADLRAPTVGRHSRQRSAGVHLGHMRGRNSRCTYNLELRLRFISVLRKHKTVAPVCLRLETGPYSTSWHICAVVGNVPIWLIVLSCYRVCE